MCLLYLQTGLSICVEILAFFLNVRPTYYKNISQIGDWLRNVGRGLRAMPHRFRQNAKFSVAMIVFVHRLLKADGETRWFLRFVLVFQHTPLTSTLRRLDKPSWSLALGIKVIDDIFRKWITHPNWIYQWP